MDPLRKGHVRYGYQIRQKFHLVLRQIFKKQSCNQANSATTNLKSFKKFKSTASIKSHSVIASKIKLDR